MVRIFEGGAGAVLLLIMEGGLGAVQVAKIGHIHNKLPSALRIRQFYCGFGAGRVWGLSSNDFLGWEGVVAVLWAVLDGLGGCCQGASGGPLGPSSPLIWILRGGLA